MASGADRLAFNEGRTEGQEGSERQREKARVGREGRRQAGGRGGPDKLSEQQWAVLVLTQATKPESSSQSFYLALSNYLRANIFITR